MKRYEFRVKGTERVLLATDDFDEEDILPDLSYLEKYDPEVGYDIYDTLFHKIIYTSGQKPKEVLVLDKEAQRALEDRIISENKEKEYGEMLKFKGLSEEARKSYWQKYRKSEKEVAKSREAYKEELKRLREAQVSIK